jgi:hypothetical protein
MDNNSISSQNDSETIRNNTDVESLKKKIENQKIIIGCVSIVAVVASFFLIDAGPFELLILMHLPIILFGIGVFLIVMSIRRKKLKMKYGVTLGFGILALSYPVLVFLLFAFSMALGAPVPT